MTWDEVLQMNIYKFNHRVKFLTNQEKEKATISKQAIANGKRTRRF